MLEYIIRVYLSIYTPIYIYIYIYIFMRPPCRVQDLNTFLSIDLHPCMSIYRSTLLHIYLHVHIYMRPLGQ